MHENAFPLSTWATNKRTFAKFGAPSFITRESPETRLLYTPRGRGGDAGQQSGQIKFGAAQQILFWAVGIRNWGDAPVFRQKIEEDRIVASHPQSSSKDRKQHNRYNQRFRSFARSVISPTHYQTHHMMLHPKRRRRRRLRRLRFRYLCHLPSNVKCAYFM